MIEYVNMEVEFTKDGAVIPKRIRWKDGRIWNIDRVIHSCQSINNKYKGIRYTVLIAGAEKYIYSDNGRWYVTLPEEVILK